MIALRLLAASARLVALCLCIALLSGSAKAQTSPATPPAANGQQAPASARHYIGAVPASPSDYDPINASGRFIWFARSTFGPRSLVAGLFTAGFGTAINSPREYGPHWEGFGDRYGMRLTGVSTGNAIEASLGAAWGEDPRYFHTVHQPFGTRVKNVLDLTFRAYHRDGERHPAYARYVATLATTFFPTPGAWKAKPTGSTP